MNQLEQRIIDISKKLGLSHIGSCLSCLPILEEIYKNKAPEDKVLMDNAHAHLAHLVAKPHSEILNLNNIIDTPEGLESMIQALIRIYGIHCDHKSGCDASGGSLGHALGIAIGMSLANPKIKIHVIVSDGSMMEGSNWEALRIISDNHLTNININCNFNGYTAVSKYRSTFIDSRMHSFLQKNIKTYYTYNGEGFEGLQGHYKKI